MSKCNVSMTCEIIKVKEVKTANGKSIYNFTIKIDSQDFKTKEWMTSFMNGKLINANIPLEEKGRYTFEGVLDNNKWTNKDGVEISQVVLTAFNAEIAGEGGGKKEQPKPAKKEVAKKKEPEIEVDEDEIPF